MAVKTNSRRVTLRTGRRSCIARAVTRKRYINLIWKPKLAKIAKKNSQSSRMISVFTKRSRFRRRRFVRSAGCSGVLAWRNERSFHRVKCALTGKSLVSGFSPEAGMTVYDRDIWWSDDWDPLSFGIDYDFSKPFFAQFADFMKKTPMPSVFNARTVNCQYAQHTGEFKNGYLVFASWGGENVSYSARVNEVKDSMDLFVVANSELCYETVAANKCYNVAFSQNVEGCNDSAFLFECRGCSNCFGCTNLRSKSYHIFNEPYSREGYLEKIKEFDLGDRAKLRSAKEKFEELKKSAIRKYANITNSPMVTGDNIINSYNCQECFDLYGDTRDCKYVQNVAIHMKESYDGYGLGATAELLYEAFDTGAQGSRVCFAAVVYGSTNVYYSYNCHTCQNCFACIGLRSKQYCIFNKQYSKEEYENLLPKIIKQMEDMPYVDKRGNVYRYGEFFPIELSPFAYNEAIVTEYVPLTKEEVLANGYRWMDTEERGYKIDLKPGELPASIGETTDDIVGKAIECSHNEKCNEQCTKAFKITEDELKFYRRMKIALPDLCPNCRHYQRLKQRNPVKLWHRHCMNPGCPNEFKTSYAPDRPEIVYCESCYQKEVY